MAAKLSDFYQMYKLRGILPITFRSRGLEIGGKIKRVVLTTYFGMQNNLLLPKFGPYSEGRLI